MLSDILPTIHFDEIGLRNDKGIDSRLNYDQLQRVKEEIGIGGLIGTNPSK